MCIPSPYHVHHSSFHVHIGYARSVKPSDGKVPRTIDDRVTLGHAVLSNLQSTKVPCAVDSSVTLGYDGSVLKNTEHVSKTV
jgi:hypothetical protein